MNNLIFSEGGQPVFLDDIKLLQDNRISAILSLFVGLVGCENDVFLLTPYSFDNAISDNGNSIKIHANSIVIRGEIVPFATAEFQDTEIAEKGVYICVKRSKEDLRTFEDGQNRYCISTITAYLSCDITGINEYYKIQGLSSLIELLGVRLGVPTFAQWSPIPVIFYNGYSGNVNYRFENGTIQLSINISSSQKSWDTGMDGVLFRIMNGSIKAFLSGITTDIYKGVPVDSSGKLMGYGSQVYVTNDGLCCIVNRTEDGNLEMGYIPPCLNDDTAGTINIILKK